MLKKKVLCLVFCLFLGFGCGGVHTKSAGQITLASGAERTVYIQTDPTKPDTAVLVQPLEAQLASKGYRVVTTPEDAVYTMRLRLAAFGLNASRPSSDPGLVTESASGTRTGVGSFPLVLSGTGTAIGGAASGSALHAAQTTGGTVGGFAGLGAGLVIGSLLRGPSGPDFKTNLHVPFNAEVDVIITDSSSGQQQATVLAAWKQVNREGQAPAAREDVVNKLAAKIAALMP